MSSHEPIMCALTPDAIRARRAGLLPGLAQRALTQAVTEHGYRLTFAASSETLMDITRTIAAERQCCRWLDFDLHVPSGDGAIVLTLSGPDGAREFLEALISYT